MSNIDLSRLEQRLPELLSVVLAQEFGATVVPDVLVLFGSRAAGRSHASSDIDVGLALGTRLDEPRRQRIEAAIAAAFMVDTDLVDLLSAPSHLVSQILRHGRILIGSGTSALGALIARMVSEREDIAPYQRRILEERVR
ncbi:MAG: nucleotidyltransferase domain-containing protein [Betaproteobacteria bacterium]|nr:nucleotidyltransferase domain-containing protein [Betaproteobacteria bacterium]